LPADVLLLKSSDSNGICYIETKAIDGETNLKHKDSIRSVANVIKSDEDAINLKGMISCEGPNEKIYRFNGLFISDHVIPGTTNKTKVSLSYDNFLLRGSSLRSTEYIYGLVIFTGHDTKIMRNSSKFRHKMSKVEKILQF
jgi:magnesium-transporting ATPase (P-type)